MVWLWDGPFIPWKQVSAVCFEIKHLAIITLEVLKHLGLNLSDLNVWHFTLAKATVFFKDLKDKVHTNLWNCKQRIRMTDHWLKEAIILDVHTKDSLLIWEGTWSGHDN